VGILLTPSLATSGAAHFKPARGLHGLRARRPDLGKAWETLEAGLPRGEIMLGAPIPRAPPRVGGVGADNTFAAAANILLSRMNLRR
jgi:hypothetical protein